MLRGGTASGVGCPCRIELASSRETSNARRVIPSDPHPHGVNQQNQFGTVHNPQTCYFNQPGITDRRSELSPQGLKNGQERTRRTATAPQSREWRRPPGSQRCAWQPSQRPHPHHPTPSPITPGLAPAKPPPNGMPSISSTPSTRRCANGAPPSTTTACLSTWPPSPPA